MAISIFLSTEMAIGQKSTAYMLSPKRTLLGHAFFGTSVSSVAVITLTLLSGVLVSRILGPEGRGNYGVLLLLAQLAASVGCLSFFDGVVVELKKHLGSERSVLPTMLLSVLGLSILIVAAAVPIFYVFAGRVVESDFAFFCIFTALIVFSQLLIQCFSALDRSQLRFGYINTTRFLSPATFCILLIFTQVLSSSEVSAQMVLVLFLLSKISEISPWLYANRSSIFGPIHWNFVRAAGSIGLKFHVAFTLTAIASQIDRLAVLETWSAEMLGLYFVAFSAVGAGYSVLTTAMNTIMLPYFTSLTESERQESVAQSLRVSVMLIACVTVVGMIALPLAIPLLYGPEFEPSVVLALGILTAMAPIPLRIIVSEVGRSRGAGQPSIEMAIATLAVMAAGWLLTGFSSPAVLIVTFGIANLASVLVGLLRMARAGEIKGWIDLIPGPRDFALIRAMFVGLWK